MSKHLLPMLATITLLVPLLRAADPVAPPRYPFEVDVVGGAVADGAVGDWDGDGILDVLVARTFLGDVAVLAGDGFGGLVASVLLPFTGTAVRMFCEDLDADGDADIVLAVKSPNALVVLFGDGTGGVAATQTIGLPVAPTDLAVADLDGDGRNDLVPVALGGVFFAANLGAGAFAPVTTIGSGANVRVAVADFNLDSVVDIALVTGGSVRVLFAAGPLTYASTPVPWTSPPIWIAAGDKDGDGRPDLIGASLDVLRAQISIPGNAFSQGPALPLPIGAGPLALGDIDGDDRSDALLGAVLENANLVTIAKGLAGAAFAAPTYAYPGVFTVRVLVADLDGDFGNDVVAVQGSGSVAVLRNGGAGSIQSTNAFPMSVFASEWHGAIADVNLDGNEDLVAAADNTGVLNVRLGDGAGGFSALLTTTIAANVLDLKVGEVTGDAFPDIVVMRSNSVEVLQGAGTEVFTPLGATATPSGSRSIVLADTDLDADQDVVVLATGAVATLSNNGSGTLTFALGPVPAPFVFKPRLASADLDGDGIDDIAYGLGSNGIAVHLANGLGGYAVHATLATNVVAGDVAIADFDGDGLNDLAALSRTTGAIDVLRASQAFASVTVVPNGCGTAQDLIVADLDRDGLQDLCAINRCTETVVFARNLGAGAFDASRSFPTSGFPTELLAGRFNGDAIPDLAILGQSLAGFLLPAPSDSVTMVLSGCPGGIGTHGVGCVGSGGFTPELTMHGCASPGSPVTLSIEHGLGGSVAVLLFGVGPTNVPIGGTGCALLVGPLLPVSIVVPLGGAGPGNGSFAAPLVIPPATTLGAVSMQAFVGDPAGVGGFSASNGITIIVR